MSGIRLLVQRARRSAIFRRTTFGAGIVVAVAAVAVTAWAVHAGKPARDADIMLLYVGAEDCAPCRAWQNGDGAAFLASAEFPRITYREVKSPHLHDVLKDEHWPDDLRNYRNGLRRSDGVPLWLVVADHRIVEQRFGATEWRASVLPRIKSLLH
ncbi:hypothetical protein KMZ68_10975 [Bradyrhizobium sediminis]|uniref:Uncharacterized protein n=1 Tax=Bradyrhizobium sediminis TaxID=2840469 RepID=A0A975RU44_9BRAD|nr:hypothetical protein [Bradyrhizobium sediminis]QWG20310.1 hypothetical protein KMZ68_10975 [Bradyrhizobium sediminis]